MYDDVKGISSNLDADCVEVTSLNLELLPPNLDVTPSVLLWVEVLPIK